MFSMRYLGTHYQLGIIMMSIACQCPAWVPEWYSFHQLILQNANCGKYDMGLLVIWFPGFRVYSLRAFIYLLVCTLYLQYSRAIYVYIIVGFLRYYKVNRPILLVLVLTKYTSICRIAKIPALIVSLQLALSPWTSLHDITWISWCSLWSWSPRLLKLW